MAERREPYNPLLKSYPDSEKINSCSEGAETLFTRLIAQCDDHNHYYGDAAMVLGKLYTRRMALGQIDLAEVQSRLDELTNARLIEIYEADGRSFIEIINCRKDLRSDVKPDIRFPKREQTVSALASFRIRPELVPNSVYQPNPTEPKRTQPKKTLPAEAGGGVLPPGFFEFWAEWPKHFRKQAKSKCFEHWRRKKLEPLADRIVSTLKIFKRSSQWARDAGQYIPFPMTWLNRTPWETDPEDLEALPSADDGLDPDDARMIAEMENRK